MPFSLITNMWRQMRCIPWNMGFKKMSVIVLLSAITHSGLQVLQAKAKNAVGDNDHRKVYSFHHEWQMLWYCEMSALTFIPKLNYVEFVAVVSEVVAIHCLKSWSGWWAVPVYFPACMVIFFLCVCAFFNIDSAPGKVCRFYLWHKMQQKKLIRPQIRRVISFLHAKL